MAVAIAAFPAIAAEDRAPADQYRSFDKDSVEIHDNHTELNWQRRDVALTTFDAVECPGGRLPTVKELLTLVAEEPHAESPGPGGGETVASDGNVYKMIDRSAFPLIPVDHTYWTSTRTLGSQQPEQVWTVDFQTGLMVAKAVTGDVGYARCVK
jgi:hypothetical protein